MRNQPKHTSDSRDNVQIHHNSVINIVAGHVAYESTYAKHHLLDGEDAGVFKFEPKHLSDKCVDSAVLKTPNQACNVCVNCEIKIHHHLR